MTQVRIVIGSNFGDEGKGLMTDFFSEEMMQQYDSCLNVLSNGGAQRGHTVVRGGQRHVFRHFGSGTFCGADTYFPAEFLVNPMIFMKEYRELRALEESSALTARTEPSSQHRGVFSPGMMLTDRKFYIHPDCPVTTPLEMITNLILEEHRGNRRHGSVGVGIWETVIGGGKCFGQLMELTREERRKYLTEDRYQRMLTRLADQGVKELPDEWKEILRDGGLEEQYLDDLEDMAALVIPADDTVLRNYEGIIFENGQGLLLDRRMKWKGYGDHTTPSYTGVRNPASILKCAFRSENTKDPNEAEKIRVETVYVTRTYMTRHGAGRFDTECPREAIDPTIRDLTNLPNPSQGSIRFGRLNYQSLLRRVRRDFRELQEDEELAAAGIRAEWTIAATHLNEYDALPKHSAYIRYKSGGEEGRNRIIIE